MYPKLSIIFTRGGAQEVVLPIGDGSPTSVAGGWGMVDGGWWMVDDK